METVFQYIRSEYAILVAILYCIGGVLKNTDAIANKWIPCILTVVGIALACLSAIGQATAPYNVASIIYDAVGQGVLCAGMSVYLHQMIKQTGTGK